MLKGLTELQQRQLEEIIAPFMLIETNMKKNGLKLSPETLFSIHEAPKIAEYATSQGLQVPKSTYDILRYGPVIENDIIPNLEKLSQYTKVKLRVRKGVQYQSVLVWDTRIIESTLKKSDKPKVKSQDDKKVFKEFFSSFSSFTNFDSDKTLFERYEQLFLAPDSPFTVHFVKGQNSLDDFKEKSDKLAQREKEKTNEQEQYDTLNAELSDIDAKINSLTEKFYSENTAGRGIKAKREQIEHTQKDDPLASYLKLLNEIIETFESYATKQKVTLSFEEQNVLRELSESPITPEENIDQHFGDLLTVISRHADVAFGKKHWYMKLLQELGSAEKIDTYFRSGPGYRAWVETREFAKDIYELQQTNDFIQYQEALNELENNKKTDFI